MYRVIVEYHVKMKGCWRGHIQNLKTKIFRKCIYFHFRAMAEMLERIDDCRIWRVIVVISRSP